MIDPSVDPSYAAFERDQARREAARARAARPRQRALPAGTLTTLPPNPSAIGSRGTLQVETPVVATTVAVPPPEKSEPSNPLWHLRLARFSLVVAVVLVFLALWVRRR